MLRTALVLLLVLSISKEVAPQATIHAQVCTDTLCNTNCTAVNIPNPFCDTQKNQYYFCKPNGIFLDAVIYSGASCEGSETPLPRISASCSGDPNKKNDFVVISWVGLNNVQVKLGCTNATCDTCQLTIVADLTQCTNLLPSGPSIAFRSKMRFLDFVEVGQVVGGSPVPCNGTVLTRYDVATGVCYAEGTGSFLYTCGN